MTILVATTDGERTWIASDQQAVGGSRSWHRPNGKWRELPCGWWLGLAGSSRALYLAELLVDPTYDARGLVEALRRLLSADRWAWKEDPGDSPFLHLEGILAKPGEVYYLSADFTLIPSFASHVTAAGSGSEYALGAAYALSQTGCATGMRETLRLAVEAAGMNDPSCKGYWSQTLEPAESSAASTRPSQLVPCSGCTDPYSCGTCPTPDIVRTEMRCRAEARRAWSRGDASKNLDTTLGSHRCRGCESLACLAASCTESR